MCYCSLWMLLLIVDVAEDVDQTMGHVKNLVTHLYTQMNLSEWQAAREKELSLTVEKLQHELEPYKAVSPSSFFLHVYVYLCLFYDHQSLYILYIDISF